MIMTEDDGYETIVPDLSIAPSDELLLAKLDYMIGFPRVFQADDFKRVVAEHRQAAYNQAIKDAAEVASLMDDDLADAILSLGDKGNG